MVREIASNAFEMVSMSMYVFMLLPPVFLNHRLKSTAHGSISTDGIWIIGTEVSLFYLLWMNQVVYACVSYGIFIGITLLISL